MLITIDLEEIDINAYNEMPIDAKNAFERTKMFLAAKLETLKDEIANEESKNQNYRIRINFLNHSSEGMITVMYPEPLAAKIIGILTPETLNELNDHLNQGFQADNN